MLEEGEESMETKRLRTDPATMIGHIEVSLKKSSIVCLEDHGFFNSMLFVECQKVFEQRRRQLEEMALVLEENKGL